MHTVYLGLGTNLGDRRANLRAAIKALAPEVQVVAESKVYETAPWGFENQPAFLNMAVKAETQLAPEGLLSHMKRVESRMGRKATFRWGPRLIDLDILLFDDLIFDSAGLVIPHPHLHERGFVLAPLADIAGERVHPVLGRTIRELLQHADASGIRPA